ncbi:hypothetical protein INQ41_07835 [Lysobacter ciconiae]|uniref:Uncharacterized protein n=1 Tax=Novilysobacter ciconiae TaxID=2781022 RepID=A0A7S6ZRD6_9GAMM|nr:hypothetical protein [Lysobacter ciconiae]QOW18620.1 hypothetical protein INQ41_07835 [Lysobacter ciconiae]
MLAFFLIVMLACVQAFAASPNASLTGEELQVFPGDKFYVEGDTTDLQTYRISEPFESRMPGALRLPFSFAIDATDLHFSHRDSKWDYYTPVEGKGRAWHGLLGNVLAKGDTVGLRVHRTNGDREWFVDNSGYNGYQTIWNRRVKGKDVEVTEEGIRSILLENNRLRALEYMGVRDGQLRVRYTEVGPNPRSEEFTFPIEGHEPILIGAMGVRAEVRNISGASAHIKVLRGFQGEGWAEPKLSPRLK